MRKIILAILISIISLTSCGFAPVDRGIATVRIRGVKCDYRLSWEVFLDSEVSERELEDIEYEIADNISRSIRLLVNITGSSDEALDTFKEQYHNFNLYEFRIGDITGHLEYMGRREVHPEKFFEALNRIPKKFFETLDRILPGGDAQGTSEAGEGGSSGSGSLESGSSGPGPLGGTAIGTSMGGSLGGALGGSMGGLL